MNVTDIAPDQTSGSATGVETGLTRDEQKARRAMVEAGTPRGDFDQDRGPWSVAELARMADEAEARHGELMRQPTIDPSEAELEAYLVGAGRDPLGVMPDPEEREDGLERCLPIEHELEESGMSVRCDDGCIDLVLWCRRCGTVKRGLVPAPA